MAAGAKDSQSLKLGASTQRAVHATKSKPKRIAKIAPAVASEGRGTANKTYGSIDQDLEDGNEFL